MKVKTADLTGPALDWAVAQLEGKVHGYKHQLVDDCRQVVSYSPSTNWPQGGPHIEQERIELFKGNPILFVDGTREALWIAKHQSIADRRPNGVHGPTPLIAAMRCLVEATLGDEVDVPDELV